MKVYLAIAKVAAKLAQEGISKARKNVQQGYAFRGIDDVYNALAPFLSSENLCILPNVLEREVVERTTKTGNALFRRRPTRSQPLPFMSTAIQIDRIDQPSNNVDCSRAMTQGSLPGASPGLR